METVSLILKSLRDGSSREWSHLMAPRGQCWDSEHNSIIWWNSWRSSKRWMLRWKRQRNTFLHSTSINQRRPWQKVQFLSMSLVKESKNSMKDSASNTILLNKLKKRKKMKTKNRPKVKLTRAILSLKLKWKILKWLLSVPPTSKNCGQRARITLKVISRVAMT